MMTVMMMTYSYTLFGSQFKRIWKGKERNEKGREGRERIIGRVSFACLGGKRRGEEEK